MDWVRILAYVTRIVDQELLAQNEYLATENRIMKVQLKGRLKLSDAEAQITPAQHPAPLRRERWRPGPNPPPYHTNKTLFLLVFMRMVILGP